MHRTIFGHKELDIHVKRPLRLPSPRCMCDNVRPQGHLKDAAAVFAMQGRAASPVKVVVLNEQGDERPPALCTQVMIGPRWSNTASRWSAESMMASC